MLFLCRVISLCVYSYLLYIITTENSSSANIKYNIIIESCVCAIYVSFSVFVVMKKLVHTDIYVSILIILYLGKQCVVYFLIWSHCLRKYIIIRMIICCFNNKIDCTNKILLSCVLHCLNTCILNWLYTCILNCFYT